MKANYLKFVQWSEPDGLYVGVCPDLFIGGACHGADEQEVFADLCAIVAEEIEESERANRPLPEKAALVTMPVAI